MKPDAEKKGWVRYRLDVTGQVQGVGFRPFVYNLARELGLSGFVVNTPAGAAIEIEGSDSLIEDFCVKLINRQPPLAKIEAIEQSAIDPVGDNAFAIRSSTHSGSASAAVTVDTAVCSDCLREMHDPADRRFRYPFINCTNCGPRYTIVTAIPYDRPNTTMAIFEMCPACRREYEDPADRRFHAQPIACPDCGPTLTLTDGSGNTIGSNPIKATADLLRGGKIVAIKGLGGFHLAVDATSSEAVARLRRLKHRDHKPLAIMAADIEQIEAICQVDDHSRGLLEDIARPIVILPQRAGNTIAQVAPGMDTLGVFLPYTPHHHLLFEEGLAPVVMTSGNLSDEPLAKDNDEALARLGGIADAFLLHNRPIYRRLDDPVVQARPNSLMMIRRARGFVPASLDLGADCPQAILAVGAELKSTVTLVKGRKAITSEHIGDLKDAIVYEHFKQVIDHLCRLYEHTPSVIAADMHPDYLSSQYAQEQMLADLIHVQHHHAHIVSCMVEHSLHEKVIGISCDGVGYGPDGAVWGCELLLADRADYERAGHLKYFRLPGGDAASKQTFRPALGLLYEAFGPDGFDSDIARRIYPDSQTRKMILQMIERKVNSPQTSSLGRLFDAAAALTQLAGTNHFEGQAPMLLEAMAKGRSDRVYDYELERDNDMLIIDPAPMIRSLADDVISGEPIEIIADAFHNTVAAFLADAAETLSAAGNIDRIVLSGGCFANKYLSARLRERLESRGLRCYEHRLVPCNDAGISLGQAACAAELLQRFRRVM